MTDATEFEAEVLATDAAFRCWVITPDASSEAHWRAILRDQPERRPILERARALVTAFPSAHVLPSESTVARMWAIIERQLS